MEDLLVTVIIPAYNTEETIVKCVNSVRRQSYLNIEVLVINDGSTDKTLENLEMLSSLDSRIKIISTTNKGLSSARNTGILHSKGSHVCFIDSDDCIDEDYVAYLVGLIKKYNVRMASCQHRVIINGKVKRDMSLSGESSVITAKKWSQLVLERQKVDLSAWGKIYEKSLFKNIEYPVGKLFEDTFTTYKLVAESRKIAVGSQAKYDYQIREGSISRSKFSKSSLDLIEATENMTYEISLNYPDLQDVAELRRCWAYGSVLNSILLGNTYRECEVTALDLRREMLKRKKVVFSKKNTDIRLSVAVFILQLGLMPYRYSLILSKFFN